VAKRRTGNAIRDDGSKPRVDHKQLRQRELARLQIANQIATLRERAGLSQAALADRIGTKQAGIARMERRDYQGYTVATLAKIAAAMGGRLEVRLALSGRVRRRDPMTRTQQNARQRT
jgi:transcriptional regulator with XRE-family HTH domain